MIEATSPTHGNAQPEDLGGFGGSIPCPAELGPIEGPRFTPRDTLDAMRDATA